MARPMKIKRRPELTACLKKNGFRKNVDGSNSDQWVYEHKADDNRVVVIRSFEIAVDIVDYKDFSMVEPETPIDQVIAHIDAQMMVANKSIVDFKALLETVRQHANGLGVKGRFVQNEVDSHSWEFFADCYKAQPLFYLSYQGPESKTELGYNYNEYPVETAYEVLSILQGKNFDYWPSKEERVMFKGKSIYTFKTHDDFTPFMFTHGLMRIVEHMGRVQLSSAENPILNELLEDQTDVKHFVEIQLRRAITADEYFDYIKAKIAEKEAAE
jgi:hypothetical protein